MCYDLPCDLPIYHVRPHQPIIDQQGLGLRGLVHKEAHPVIYDLHLPYIVSWMTTQVGLLSSHDHVYIAVCRLSLGEPDQNSVQCSLAPSSTFLSTRTAVLSGGIHMRWFTP